MSLKQFSATVIISVLIKNSLAENQHTKTQWLHQSDANPDKAGS